MNQTYSHILLKGKLVSLRTLEPTDVDFIMECENNPDNWRISQTVQPFSRHMIEKFVLSDQDVFTHQQVRFVVCDINNKRVGTVDIFDYDPINMRAGLGILIIENERNKGYALEAIQLCTEYAFEVLLLHALFCNVLETNEVSLSLFQKAGFQVSGTKLDWVRTNDDWINEIILQRFNNGKEE